MDDLENISSDSEIMEGLAIRGRDMRDIEEDIIHWISELNLEI